MHSLQSPVDKLGRSPEAEQASSDANAVCFAASFACAMSATSGALCAIVRSPLAGPHWFVIVKAFLLLTAVVSCVVVLAGRSGLQRRASHGSMVLAIIAVMFMPCLALVNRTIADILVYPILLGAISAGVLRVVALARSMARPRLMLAIMCGCGAGIGYFFVVNSRGYATVLTPEQALTGLQHLDTLFHASIANMLVKYGVLSTGLDGLAHIKYHFLSHIWLGGLGLWLRVSTLEAYYIAAQIVAVPLLLFSLVSSTNLLRQSSAGPIDSALITLVPLLFLLTVDLWGWTSYLVSESYFLALILFLLGLPLLAEIASDDFRLRPSLQVVALVVVGVLMLLSKISVGAIYWAATGFLLWRQLGLTLLNLLGLAIPILLLVGTCAAFTSPDSGTYLHALRPLSFVREYPQGALPNIVANLILLCVAWPIWRSGSGQQKKLAEVFAIIAIGGLAPALLLDLAGGAAYYFVNVGTWACIVFVSAHFVPSVGGRRPGFAGPAIVLFAILLVALATDEKRSSLRKFAAQFEELRARVGVLIGDPGVAALPPWRRVVALLAPGDPVRRKLAEDLKRTPGAQARQTLVSLGVMDNLRTAVFVPPDNQAFWSTYLDCRGNPLFVPAILGVPMLKGLNPAGLKCARDPFYSFAAYRPDAISEVSTDLQLCARAAELGFRWVVVLMTPTAGRKIECRTE